jgi:hypothetical protein
MLPDRTKVDNKYIDPGTLCKCKANREAPGPDHDKLCPWYANARLKMIHLKPEQSWAKDSPVSVKADFIFERWEK